MPKRPTQISRAEALAELQRRCDAAIAAFTPEAIAGGHAFQVSILSSEHQNLLFMCSRRAGKTFLCCALLALTALRTPDVSCLYLALTSGQAKKVWARTWKRLLRKFNLPAEHSESDMTTTFPSGSVVVFGGTDDLRHVQTLLGDSMAGGIAIIDEAQSDPGLMESLVVDVLGPMLDETTAGKPVPGRLVLAGTVPEVAAGYFWKTWAANHEVEGSPWGCYAWSRFDNPHEHDNRKHLDSYLRKYHLNEADPIVQRNWFGARVFDAAVTAYRYNPAHAWVGIPAPWLASLDFKVGPLGHEVSVPLTAVLPPPGVNTFSIGLDPASRRDRYGIVMWGWGPLSSEVWQVAEWVTPEGAGTLQSQWVAVLAALREHYGNVVRYLRDAGSAAESIDLIHRDYSMLVEAVAKGPGSLKGRVDRFADVLGQGRCHPLAGSQLERDLTLCRWDQAAREKGKWQWSNVHHGDTADAGGYGLVGWFDASEPKKVAETYEQTAERIFRESFVPPVQYGYQSDPALDALLGETGPIE